ncbi:MAG TPA: S9 family peptidase [candidate division Zixibacteria bacterium]|nr:S9 family peptidase [candidate division Zixibacteria bacterium]
MKRNWILIILIIAAILTGISILKSAVPPSQKKPADQRYNETLIPRQVLFGNPDRASPLLSSDETKIGYLAPVNGVLNVWVGPAEDPAAAKPVTNDTSRGIRTYFWAYTNKHILYLQDKNGDENWRLNSVDLITGQNRDLTPVEGVRAQIQEVSFKFPDEMLVGLNDRNPQYHDIYRVNIDTGERSLVQKNEGFLGFITDDDYKIRFAMRFTSDGGNEMLKKMDNGSFEQFAKIELDDTLTTSPIGFDRTGRLLYMMDSRGRDTAALTAIDIDTGISAMLAHDARADLSGALIHPTEKNVQAAAFTYERRQWQVLDDSIAKDMSYLRTVADGDMEVVSRTLDDKRWVVAYVTDDGPVLYYLYDRDEKKAQFLFTNRKALEGLPLAKIRPVIIKARDGLDMVSYLTLPSWMKASEKPLPMVLFVHGGPWARDEWGFNPWHQWLANRGYAVLSVNYRGSTGFGKKFVNAGNMEWGGKMHDDLIDAVQWAVKEGIADPERIAIMGGSYGGYATLVGMTFTPDRFACGVDIVGPSNLVTLLNTIPPYWVPEVEQMKKRVGDYTSEEGRELLRSRSPLTYADRIKKPLLIGQGANDPRVKQNESDQIVKAMQAKNINVTYVLYPDEGHGFVRPENRISFNAVAEAFLSKCTGGRFEPVGADFAGSTITVQVGREQIPGLEEALGKVH